MAGVIKPKQPRGSGWHYGGPAPSFVMMGYEGHYWMFPGRCLLVISAVEVATDADGSSNGPEYHMSISRQSGARCTSNEAKWVLRQFDLEEAEEDNHVPSGLVRNFWRPVADRLVGKACPCKADEPAIREDKGDYVWRGFGR